MAAILCLYDRSNRRSSSDFNKDRSTQNENKQMFQSGSSQSVLIIIRYNIIRDNLNTFV